MADFLAVDPFDIQSVNLYWYIQNYYDNGVEKAVNIVIDGVTYPDDAWIEGVNASTFSELDFFGRNFTSNSSGDLTGGTVNFIGEFDLNHTTVRWIIDGISTPAAALYQTIFTSSNADEVSILQTALAGDDSIILSSFDDRMNGYGGDDVISGGLGSDILDGGAGTDTALFAQSIENYTISFQGATLIVFSPVEGTDRLTGFEFASFNNVVRSVASLADTTPPTVVSFSPADGDNAVGINANIVLNFSEAIQKGQGILYLRSGSADGPIVEQYDISTTSRVSISGSALTIDPFTVLNSLTHYYLSLDAGSITDLPGNAYVGTSSYDFTTALENHLPAFSSAIARTATLAGNAVQFTGVATDSDGDALTYSAASASHGAVTGGAGGTFTYTPTAGFTGLDSFTVTANDGHGGIASQLVTVRVAANASQMANTGLVRDYNGDGRDDVLWREDAGAFTEWLGQANSTFVWNVANVFSVVPTDRHIVGTGDFNGDGRSDILWRSDSGAFTDWLGQANGSFVINDAIAGSVVPTDWHVTGTGDFNGDGRSDLLWRNDAGAFTQWLGQANGGFVWNVANVFYVLPTDWHVTGTGDFNGDGRSDVLWRNDSGAFTEWLGQDNGGFVWNVANVFSIVPTDRHVAGTGDFNGDGRSDILWRNDAGLVTEWLGQANGGFVVNDAVLVQFLTSVHVNGTGDFNGDGRSDVLLRSDSGLFTEWLGQANGSFVSNDANVSAQVPTSWHVQLYDSFAI